jgi:hypothetical protein
MTETMELTRYNDQNIVEMRGILLLKRKIDKTIRHATFSIVPSFERQSKGERSQLKAIQIHWA